MAPFPLQKFLEYRRWFPWHHRCVAITSSVLSLGVFSFLGNISTDSECDYYQTAIGATHIGGQKMIIFPDAALKLIKKYFPDK